MRAQFSVGRLGEQSVDEAARLVAAVISSLEYYSNDARQSEIAKYTPQSLLEAIQDDPDSVLVASSADGAIVGFCISNIDDGLIWLAWFGVHAEWRRTGVGRALLEALDQTVRARGAHKTWCDCRTVNRASAMLLTSVGFSTICTLTSHWYGHDFLLLEKAAP